MGRAFSIWGCWLVGAAGGLGVVGGARMAEAGEGSFAVSERPSAA